MRPRARAACRCTPPCATRVALGALEVEAAELHALVDVHVRHQLDLRVLRQVQRGIARPPLVLGQRENGVLGVASRVHEAGRRCFYSYNAQDLSIGRSNLHLGSCW